MHRIRNHSSHVTRQKSPIVDPNTKKVTPNTQANQHRPVVFRLDAPLPLPGRPLAETVFPNDCHCQIYTIARPESIDYPPINEVPPKRVSR